MDTRVLAAGIVAVSIVGGALSPPQAASVGDFEASADVGAPRLPGSATYNAFSQEYRLSAAGVNMWGPWDEFHFVWKRLQGGFILRARVRLLGDGGTLRSRMRKHGVRRPANRAPDAGPQDPE